MKKFLLGLRTGGLAFLLLFGLVTSHDLHADACPPKAPEVNGKDLAQHARDRGFLWRISKDGHASYLYGTIHVGHPEWLFPGPVVSSAIVASDTIALEIDMLEEGVAADLQKMMADMPVHTLPEGLRKRLEQQFQKVCLPYPVVEKIMPELQIALLQMELGRWYGVHPEFAIDPFLSGIGRGANIKVVSLETPQEQLKALKAATPQESAILTERALYEIESGRAGKILERIFNAWRESNYRDLSKYAEWCHCRETEAERQLEMRLLNERNYRLANKIDTLHTDNHRVFVAVGSLHLFGDVGLPSLMAKKGYQVEQLFGEITKE